MIRRNALKVGLESLFALLPLRGTAIRGDAGAARPQAGSGVLNVRDFGAVGDGRTDDHPAITRALAAARKAGEFGQGTQGAVVFFPPGIYRVSRTLDCTYRQYNLIGAGPYQSVLRGATRGSGDAVIDFTGSGYSSVRDLLIDVVTDANGDPTPRSSTVGILIARTTNADSVSGVNLQNVAVKLKSDPGANHGRGTVAVYNFAAEETNYHDVYLRGDCGLMVTAYNTPADGGYGLASAYREILGRSASTTAISVTGLSTLVGIAGPALRLNGGAAMQVDAFLYSLGQSPEFPRVPRYPFAIHSTGLWIDFRHVGGMEKFQGLLHLDGYPMYGARLYSTMNRETAQPAIRLSGNSSLQGCDLDIAPTAETLGVASYLIDDDYDPARGTPQKSVSGSHIKLRNQKIRLRSPGSGLQGNMIQSSQPLDQTLANLSAAALFAGNVITAADAVQAGGVTLRKAGGWGAPTGTATRRAFDTSTATTRDVAERLKALIDDLSARGLLGP